MIAATLMRLAAIMEEAWGAAALVAMSTAPPHGKGWKGRGGGVWPGIGIAILKVDAKYVVQHVLEESSGTTRKRNRG